jgi:hypothetical protein
MGQTITAWQTRVREMIRDAAAIDCPGPTITELGIRPAISQFSIDHPRRAAVDVAAVGRYVPLPSEADGWQHGWSVVQQLEAPAGQTPPAVLLDTDWQSVRDPADPAVQRILIPAAVENEQVRVVYTAAWPMPAGDAALDLIPSIGFDAVCSLAAAMCCTGLASEAARDRQGAMPSDFVDGADRARDLLDAATAFRTLYLTFVGLGQVGNAQTSSSARELRSTGVRGATKRLSERWESTWPFHVR